MRAGVLLLLFLAAPAFAAGDDEMRVINMVVDLHVEEARRFWDKAQRKRWVTMRGDAAEIRPTHLAVILTTIPPLLKPDEVHDHSPQPEEETLERWRRRPTPLFRAYAALPHGGELSWLRRRRDLVVVPRRWSKPQPEAFYARYPQARGLLMLSEPAVVGDEALVYAQLMMVYSVEGRLFHLRKSGGRWRVVWQLTLYDLPGC